MFQNWFGEVSTEDNREFKVKNRAFQLKSNNSLSVRFYIKYDTKQPPPQLSLIRLNGKTVCPQQISSTEATNSEGELLTSGPAVTRPGLPQSQPTPAPSEIL